MTLLHTDVKSVTEHPMYMWRRFGVRNFLIAIYNLSQFNKVDWGKNANGQMIRQVITKTNIRK